MICPPVMALVGPAFGMAQEPSGCKFILFLQLVHAPLDGL